MDRGAADKGRCFRMPSTLCADHPTRRGWSIGLRGCLWWLRPCSSRESGVRVDLFEGLCGTLWGAIAVLNSLLSQWLEETSKMGSEYIHALALWTRRRLLLSAPVHLLWRSTPSRQLTCDERSGFERSKNMAEASAWTRHISWKLKQLGFLLPVCAVTTY